MPGKPCVFFDRDGIVNEPPSRDEYYVLRPEQFTIIPEFLQSLRVANDHGYEAVIVSNQLCVSKGMITMEEIDRIHEGLWKDVKHAGARLLGIYVCPHGGGHPDQKPNPGMLLRAASDHGLDLSAAWMIGDKDRDLQAGRAAGCAVNVLVSGTAESDVAHHHLQHMRDLPEFLEQNLPQTGARRSPPVGAAGISSGGPPSSAAERKQ